MIQGTWEDLKGRANQKAHCILDVSYNTLIQSPGHKNNRRVQLQEPLTSNKYTRRWMPCYDSILSCLPILALGRQYVLHLIW
jgi:hypothetical protein